MTAIAVPPGIPGIGALLAARPDTAEPLTALAQQLLRGPSPLSAGVREAIAAQVSLGNDCAYCHGTHAAAAEALLADEEQDTRLPALLAVAEAVRRGGQVPVAVLSAARAAGADDDALHDTVLIAAAFCMYNRYVDGLATPDVADPQEYPAIAARLVRYGYGR